MFLYGERVLYCKFFLLKKLFYREKYKWKCKIYMLFEKYIFLAENKIYIILQAKCKSFLNIYPFCKKDFFDHKKYIC